MHLKIFYIVTPDGHSQPSSLPSTSDQENTSDIEHL